MTIQRLQKAVLLLFYSNPLYTVALNLLGHNLLEYIQKGPGQEMFANDKLFKAMEEMDTRSDAELKGKYSVVCKGVTTTMVGELMNPTELARIVECLLEEICEIINEGRCVGESLRIVVNQLTAKTGALDLFVHYIRRTDE